MTDTQLELWTDYSTEKANLPAWKPRPVPPPDVYETRDVMHEIGRMEYKRADGTWGPLLERFRYLVGGRDCLPPMPCANLSADELIEWWRSATSMDLGSVRFLSSDE